MKVVALVSGGKDSCYNMMLCEKHGHEIVVLANLLPYDDAVDELDSFMYQTVGHQLIESYAQCTGLPLLRRRIRGKSRVQGMRYKATRGDEVEDMEVLLRAAVSRFPEVQAVSSGAIASDYQRVRVEAVCARLGLVSLAYLWRQDQPKLLREMVENHIHAILVKVAAIGLDPEKHLGKSIAEMEPHLKRLAAQYGINVCGEGGEYETLTLDCPLFKKARIALDEVRVDLHSPGSIASVGVLHPVRFHLESKVGQPILDTIHRKPSLDTSTGGTQSGNWWVEEVEGGSEIEADESGAATSAEIAPSSANEIEVSSYGSNGSAHPGPSGCTLSVTRQRHGFTAIGCFKACGSTPPAASSSVADDVSTVLRTIAAELARAGLGWADVLYVHLYLADMSKFGEANKAYVENITESICVHGVPSRSTVEAPLGAAELGHVAADVLAVSPGAATSALKHVLHVQSISSWAPSCIGPYSQVTEYAGLLHMAGMLGLEPATMSLPKGGVRAETSNALGSLEAVTAVYGTSARKHSIACTIYCAAAAGFEGRVVIEAQLRAFFSGKRQSHQLALPDWPENGLAGDNTGAETVEQERGRNWADGNDDDDDDDVGDEDEDGGGLPPLIHYVVLPGLPKGAMVEIAPLVSVSGRHLEQPESGSEAEDEENARTASSWAAGLAAVPSGAAAPVHVNGIKTGPSEDREGAEDGVSAAIGDVLLHDMFWEGRVVRGRFCRAHASTTVSHSMDCRGEGGPGNEASGGSNGAHGPLEGAVQRCLTALGRALSEASLAWGDVATLRVYHVVEHVPRGALWDTLQRYLDELAAHDPMGGAAPGPLLVPVLGVGPTAAAEATLAFELLAYGKFCPC